MRFGIALAVCAALAAGCGSGSHTTTTQSSRPPPVARWPAPSDPMHRARLAALTPEPAEQLAYHVHAHLDIFVNGHHDVVPAAIGIDITDPAVHEFAEADGSIAYGGIDPPCADACISPLHTHADDGVLHTESPVNKLNTLGEFFTEWNVRLTPKCVGTFCRPKTSIAFYLAGRKYTADPRAIQLTNLLEIAIVIGKPPATIPSRF